MLPIRCCAFLFGIIFLVSTPVFSAEDSKPELKPVESTLGSWIFSGMVTNEAGDKYGYFFEMKRQGSEFHAKAALIDGQTNQLIFFYEEKELITQETLLNWHVGHAFIRFNPINDSWVFGVKNKDKKGFNFKVDMLKQSNQDKATLILRPGVKLQALQTSQLNGHILVDEKEQFVTGNKAWFGKLILTEDQKNAHDISATFCHLNDDNGFYSAKLKEQDALSAAVAGWLGPTGNRVKMSQFVSIKSLDNHQCVLNVSFPKLTLKLLNTLKADDSSHAIAGFSKENKAAFCFVTEELFKEKVRV
jgi:hypothetical protein